MYQVKASEVNNLRKRTKSGIMDCKKALIESSGNFDKAIEILRKKGKKISINRFNYNTNEGVVIAKVNKSCTKGIILGLNCETDFVSKNENFIKLTNNLAEKALLFKNKEEFLKSFIGAITVKEKLIEQTGIIGEKINLGIFEFLESSFISCYTHNGNKIATLIGFSDSFQNIDKVGKNLAMQVTAMNPLALTKKELSNEIIEKEKEIAREGLNKECKSENILNQIVEGKLKKFFSENVLIYQPFIKNNKLSVLDYLKSFDKNIRITSYKRISI